MNSDTAQKNQPQNNGLIIDGWIIDPLRLRIEKDDQSIKLEHKVMQVLLLLVDHAGEPVTRDVLGDSVWKGVVVGDEAITNAVNKLRRSFGDDRKNPRVIETIPKVGYTLIAEVSRSEPAQSAFHTDPAAGVRPAEPSDADLSKLSRFFATKTRTALTAALALVIFVVLLRGFYQEPTAEPDQANYPALPDIPSIAVLPFENLSAVTEHAYFADGITDDLITDLSKISGLFVIARNSSLSYRDKRIDARRVGQELGVRHLLQGSVQRLQNRVRINVQLIDASTGGHLWAERFDGDLGEVFDLQDSVTRKIVATLAVRFSTTEQAQIALNKTEHPAAYDEYLIGWQHYLRQSPADFKLAIAHFKKAVEIDEDYHRAYAALAATYWQAAKRYWDASIGLPALTHQAYGFAEEYLEKALITPTSLAHQIQSDMLSQAGHNQEAIGEAERAVVIDPNDADAYVALAAALTLSGEPGRALELIEGAMRRNPHYPASYLYQLGMARFTANELEQAAEAFELASALSPEDRNPQRMLLVTYALLNRNDAVRQIFSVIEKNDQRGRMRSFDPLTIRSTTFWIPFRRQADRERLIKGLRLAGVPD